MPRRSPALIALLALLAPFPVLAAVDPEAGLPLLDAIPPGAYQGHPQVWAAAEDRAGILYFGNLHSVRVFDGAEWSPLPVPGANSVRALAIDRNDTLWLGGVDELGFAAANPAGRRTFVSLKAQLPPEARACGDIWRVVNTPRGPLFQSASWLMRWDGKAFATLRLPESLRWRSAIAGDEPWVSDIKHGWFIVRDDGAALRLEPAAPPEGCAGDRIAAILPGSAEGEHLFVTVNHGIWRRNAGAFTRFHTVVDEELARAGVYHACRLPDGRLALTSLQAGAWLLSPAGELLAHFTTANGLPENTAINAYAARGSPSLWLSLARGVARVDTRDWLTWFHAGNGAPSGKLYPPVRRGAELFAAASSGGHLRLVPATAAQPARLVPVPEAPRFLNTAVPFGEGWVGGGPTGLVAWSPQHLPAPLPNSPANGHDLFPLRSHPGKWAALCDGEVHLYQQPGGETPWRHLGRVADLTHVRGFAETDDGAWWLGGPAGGVRRVTFPQGLEAPPVIDSFSAGQGLPAGHGWTRVIRDDKGVLLACFPGLFRHDAAARGFIPTREYGELVGDGSTTVHACIPDRRGGLWMVITPNEGELAPAHNSPAYARDGKLDVLNVPKLRTVEDPGYLAHEPGGDGRPEALWIAAQATLFRIDIDRWRAAPPPAPPAVHLHEARTRAGELLPVAGGWRLRGAAHTLQLRFAAPGLAGDPDRQFETTLEAGGDTNIVRNDSPRRELTFAATGVHRLRVRASASDGRWSDPYVLTFTVLPPWWRSGWAWAGYVAAGVAVLAAAVRLRNRALRRRNRELEAAVAARTAELAELNRELARLYHVEAEEKVAATLAAERARLEVLRYQLNPHFLFNTLTSICAQIMQEPVVARATVVRLAEFCRLTLHRPESEGGNTVAHEVGMLTAYLDIEKTRLGPRIEVAVGSDPALDAVRLPPFLLLPLVENAVKYGTATSADLVRVRLTLRRESDGAVLIEVANSGTWSDPGAHGAVPSTSIGLINLRERLQRHFPGAHDFSTSAADGWVVARLRLRPRQP